MSFRDTSRYVVMADPVMGSPYDVAIYKSLDLAVNEAKRLTKSGFFHVVEKRNIVWSSDK